MKKKTNKTKERKAKIMEELKESLIYNLMELESLREKFDEITHKIKKISDEKNILEIEICRIKAQICYLQRELSLK